MNALKLILPSLALMTSLTMEAQQAYNPAHVRVDSGADNNGHHSRDELKVIAELPCNRF